MMEWWHRLLQESPFSPHGICLLWDPSLLTWTILGQGMVVIAYFSIPMQLAFLVYWAAARKRRLAIRRSVAIALLFALFILLCGISHALDILVLWKPFY